MDKRIVAIRTQGGHVQGMGDLKSSLSLAAAMRKNGYRVILLINDNLNVRSLCEREVCNYVTVKTAYDISSVLEDCQCCIGILNQLKSPPDEIRLFRQHCQLVATIDDTGPFADLADIRLNPLYPIEGALNSFALTPIDSCFQKWRDSVRQTRRQVNRILVLQGGSDTYGFTPKIITALSKVPPTVAIQVVLGPNFAHQNELAAQLFMAERPFELIRGRNDLSELMWNTDIAVSAAGITIFELACLGVPAIAVCAEKFEALTAERLEKAGVCQNLGFGQEISPEAIYAAVKKLMEDFKIRSCMSQKARCLIDGLGTYRMADLILECYKSIRK